MATGVLSYISNGKETMLIAKDWKWSYSDLDVIIMSKEKSSMCLGDIRIFGHGN